TKRRKEEDEDEYEGFELGFGEKMAFLKGEPLIRKLALVSKYAVLPGAMIAALVYSPPDFVSVNVYGSYKIKIFPLRAILTKLVMDVRV
ncbi:hypothetical protein G4B88_003157, partial [Cannabis sativa]